MKISKKNLAGTKPTKKVKEKAKKAITRLLLKKMTPEQAHKLDIHFKLDRK